MLAPAPVTLATSLSRGGSKNWAESMKRSCPKMNEMYWVCIGDALEFIRVPLVFCPGQCLGHVLHQEMGVIPSQIMEHDRYGGSLGTKPQLKVAAPAVKDLKLPQA